MSLDNTAERLEEVERLVADLVEDNAEWPVLVEGVKDEAALRALGLEGALIRVKGAASLFEVAERVAAAGHRKVILLMDWDRTGGNIARLMTEALEANGVRCDATYRKAFAQATKKEVVCVEALARYVGNLRLAARKHPGRRTSL